ncbi:hypothetical protein [Glaciecola sp. MF2-115]|uniref:hypothetical protein n=1 Tax=Glaciecola sp. MF2-115 TaxID=3384827 RepID=UPI0039A2EDAC
MNKLINIILSGLLWRKYKFFILSLIVLIAFIFVVGQVHQDYLRYNELQDTPTNIGLSFAVKWLIWAGSIILFLVANHYFNQHKRKQKELASEQSNSALSKLLKWKSRISSSDTTSSNDSSKTQRKASGAEHDRAEKSNVSESDPFAAIRKKEKLRSYADVVIEKKPDKPT